MKEGGLFSLEELKCFLSTNKHLRLPTFEELCESNTQKDVYCWCTDIYTGEKIGLSHDGEVDYAPERGTYYYAIFLEKEGEEERMKKFKEAGYYNLEKLKSFLSENKNYCLPTFEELSQSITHSKRYLLLVYR